MRGAVPAKRTGTIFSWFHKKFGNIDDVEDVGKGNGFAGVVGNDTKGTDGVL
jgi:hypothetical protein